MTAELTVELRRLEQEGRTGVLETGDGAFHLTEGVITSADCGRATGLDRIAAEAGAATALEWQRAQSGKADPLPGRAQLETLALLAVFDAAYFLLASSAAAQFRDAPSHWLSGVCGITPHALMDECARRGDPESGPWPASLVDRAPVLPVRRVRRKRVVLTGGQVEVLAAADSQRSVAAIAHDLGRTTFGCLAAVRDLTTAGLIEPAVAAPAPAIEARFAPTEPPLPPLVTKSGVLPRRRARPPASIPPSDDYEPVDHDVLVRLRAALKELA